MPQLGRLDCGIHRVSGPGGLEDGQRGPDRPPRRSGAARPTRSRDGPRAPPPRRRRRPARTRGSAARPVRAAPRARSPDPGSPVRERARSPATTVGDNGPAALGADARRFRHRVIIGTRDADHFGAEARYRRHAILAHAGMDEDRGPRSDQLRALRHRTPVIAVGRAGRSSRLPPRELGPDSPSRPTGRADRRSGLLQHQSHHRVGAAERLEAAEAEPKTRACRSRRRSRCRAPARTAARPARRRRRRRVDAVLTMCTRDLARRRVDAHELVVVEVALLDAPVLEGDLAVLGERSAPSPPRPPSASAPARG